MADARQIPPQFYRQVTFDDLAVVAVELHLEVGRTHFLAEGLGLVLAIEEEPRHVPGVDRLQQHGDSDLGRLGRGMGQVLQVHRVMAGPVLFRRQQAGHHVDP
ncbi:hypothetical protein PproGo58_26500 [Pseudomonas protegens]|nr:hypothetical protein PproGo58_26500 [Pseudomonas protegens]